ncbi:hypothetical protein WJX82_005331 [Trebouxia sp. C0006]
MQLAAYLEQAPSLIKSVPEPLDALDSLLASPSMWELDAMLPDQLENSSDRSGARAQTAFASGESAAPAAPNNKQFARSQYRVDAGEDRKLAMSREVQKRFRQRQKARKASIETELDATKADLQELRFRQQQLESRNVLLERVAKINNADNVTLSAQGLVCPSLARKAISGEPVLIITLWDQHHSMTVDAVSRMSTKEFSHLWTAYVHNMGRLLLDNSDRGTDTEQALIQMLTEAACLHCCISAYNVDTLKAALASRLDTGLPSDRHLGDAFYSQFLAMADLSEQQTEDMLHLRRMCITRRGQLANCRKAKLSQIPAECFSDIHMPHPAENVVKLHSLGAFVRENGSEDFKVWSATLCACLRGVLTGRQHAMALGPVALPHRIAFCWLPAVTADPVPEYMGQQLTHCTLRLMPMFANCTHNASRCYLLVQRSLLNGLLQQTCMTSTANLQVQVHP